MLDMVFQWLSDRVVDLGSASLRLTGGTVLRPLLSTGSLVRKFEADQPAHPCSLSDQHHCY